MIPPHVKFQVNILDAFTFVSKWIEPTFQDHVYPVYQSCLVAALARIQAEIPHHDLSIQLTITAAFPGLKPSSPPSHVESVANTDIVAWTATFIDTIASDVEIGFHVSCGNDVQHQYHVQAIADLVSSLRIRLHRRIAWFHIPSPSAASEDDNRIFTPLKSVTDTLLSDGTKLYLGLVRARDLTGTVRRMRAAANILETDDWGIGADRGLGDMSMEDFEDILRILEIASRM